MDPTTALATITQLLGIFVQERKGQTDLKREEFLDWLEAHRHEEIKNLISCTYHLSVEVDDILRADHAQILGELSQINGTLAQVMSRLSSFAPLAATLAPQNTLSDFAMETLCHFEGYGRTRRVRIHHHDRQSWVMRCLRHYAPWQ